MKTIEFNNIKLCTESFGKPEDPAILLIMGSASSMVWWEVPFCELLAENGFFVIRYDNRDTGASTCYPVGKPDYTLEDMADDAIKILDGYGISKATIMGMSLGSVITQIAALRHPDRVSGIILLASMYFAEGADRLPGSSPEVTQFFEELSMKESPTDTDELVEFALSQWKMTNQSDLPHDIDHIRKMIYVDVRRATNYASRLNHSFVPATGDALLRISEISCPCLVIHGTKDIVIPYVHGEMLAKTIPGAKLLTLDGAGHEMHPLDYSIIVKNICEIFR
ncbi:pimeloyl-ACP methyl ester carboxylesterase [Aequitasia blattaphilus]|uniref:Alpha/beta fold hydrolase n=1 Tax=Aequitasia blattaphilus TaxID=2949332 RepID=A0ABT1E7X7_9FIRM|nr:alpha/beta hydrolase [Aequitasia blattaphilus]MCP1101724.1 alpha/beta fold hydrolase [Aequitasia blattaphilus]MCR8614364.1 alpha/beta fold hydrolase [Aequitasia blattaphilus]